MRIFSALATLILAICSAASFYASAIDYNRDFKNFFSKAGTTYQSFTKEQLLEIYTQKNGQETLSEFIAKLPEHFRLLRMEIYESRSMHCATSSKPRIVMFNREDGLFCGFNSGDPADYKSKEIYPGECDETLDTLECMSFDDSQKKNVPFTLNFQPEQKERKPRVTIGFENSPKACIACHLESGRSIMDGYFIWAGFYGSADDLRGSKLRGPWDGFDRKNYKLPTVSAKEQAMFEEYVKGMSGNPRYSKLPAFPEKSMGSAGYDGIRINDIAMGIMEGFNNKRVSPLIEEALAKRPAAVYTLIAINQQCRLSRALPAEKVQSLNKKIQRWRNLTDTAAAELRYENLVRYAQTLGTHQDTSRVGGDEFGKISIANKPAAIAKIKTKFEKRSTFPEVESFYIENNKRLDRTSENYIFYAMLEAVKFPIQIIPMNMHGYLALNQDMIAGGLPYSSHLFPILNTLEAAEGYRKPHPKDTRNEFGKFFDPSPYCPEIESRLRAHLIRDPIY